LPYRTRYLKAPYREKRKDRRILFPPLVIVLDGASYRTTNWSFGGFLIEGHPGAAYAAYGDTIAGTIGWEATHFPFTATIRHANADPAEIGVSFHEIADETLAFLDRRLSDYLAATGRRR
jgi:hypothetical protein